MKRMRSKDRVIEELNGEYSSVMRRKVVLTALVVAMITIGGITLTLKFAEAINAASPFLITKLKAFMKIGAILVVCLGVCYWTGREYLNRNH